MLDCPSVDEDSPTELRETADDDAVEERAVVCVVVARLGGKEEESVGRLDVVRLDDITGEDESVIVVYDGKVLEVIGDDGGGGVGVAADIVADIVVDVVVDVVELELKGSASIRQFQSICYSEREYLELHPKLLEYTKEAQTKRSRSVAYRFLHRNQHPPV